MIAFLRKDVYGKLLGRFNLYPIKSLADQFGLLFDVRPVTVIDPPPVIRELVTAAIPVLAPANILVLTVPTGKCWKIIACKIFKSSGTLTMADINGGDPTITGYTLVFKTQATGNPIQMLPIDGQPHLGPGFQLYVNADVVSVAGSIVGNFIIEESDAV